MASTNRRLHWINTVFPGDIDFPGHTDGLIVPSGLTSDRPASPDNGTIRYNTTTKVIEGYTNGVWVVLGESGTGGVATFTDLSDTPNSYLGHANKLLRVNTGTTGVEFVDGDTLFLPLSGGTMNSGATITMVGATIKGVPAPQVNNDVANKEYVDAIAAGFSVKESVHAATTGPIDLATQGLASIDDHGAFDDDDRVLVKDQVDATENGIYAAHTGTWTRTLDMDGTPSNEVQGGTTTYVQEGTVNGDTNWVVIWDGDVVVDTDPMNWSLVSAGSAQNLWETFQDDSAATITATGPTETLIIAGGTGISTAVASTTLTITNDSPNIVQDVFGTITGDTGTAAASGDANILAIVGDGVTTSTAITNGPDTLTISVIGGPLASRLQDVDNNTFIDLEYAAPDSNNIRMETGLNTGAAGGNIDMFASIGDANRDGGGFNLTTGAGGDSASAASSGLGGAITITSGDGGTGPFVFGSVGSDAGSIQITSGDGGTGTDAGNGGDITITSGEPGSFDDGGISGFGGDITLLPGGVGSEAGAVVIGQASHLWPNTDGGANTVLTTDGAGNLSFAAAQAAATELPRPYDLAAQVLGNVTASSMIFKFVAPRDMVLFDFGHRLDSETLPPSNADFDITLNGSTIGTARFYSAGGVAFDFGGSGGWPSGAAGPAVQHAIARGDILRIIAPATSTVGFDDVAITLRGGVEPNVPVAGLSISVITNPSQVPNAGDDVVFSVTGEFTHIEYAIVAISTNGTAWYPMSSTEGAGSTVVLNDGTGNVTFISESEYITSTSETVNIEESTPGTDNWYRIQATVYGPGGIKTVSADIEFLELF